MFTDCNKKNANLHKMALPDSCFKDRHANERSGIFLSPDERIQLALCGLTCFVLFLVKISSSAGKLWSECPGDRLQINTRQKEKRRQYLCMSL